MGIHITTENAHDPMCKTLVAELSAELGPLYGTDGQALFSPDDVTIPRAAFVVAWLDDAPIGCGAVRPMKHDDTLAEIKRMYVRPAGRGKGVSRQILAKLEGLAKQFNYLAVQLETGDLQTAAINLYESSGYERIACYAPYDKDPRSLCYKKQL